MKDVTLVTGIKDWTADSRGRTVHEFFAQIDTYAKVSNCSEEGKARIAKAKLQGIALQFVEGRELLSNDACPYAILRENIQWEVASAVSLYYVTRRHAREE
jgi:hypothetical protein